MLKRIEGLVIKSIPYSESSLILTLMTKEYGKIGVIAKGAKKMKSKLRSSTQLFTHGLFYVYFKQEGLSTLTSVDVTHNYPSFSHDLLRNVYGSIMLELVDRIDVEVHQQHSLFELLIHSLCLIENIDPEVALIIFELQLLPYLGIGMQLDECVFCGSKRDIVSFDTSSGGLICRNCATEKTRGVSGQAIQLLRKLSAVEIQKVNSITLRPTTKKLLNQLIDEYYDLNSGLYLKTKKYLKELININNQIK